MSQNAETPRAVTGAFPEDLAGGEAAPTVTHRSDVPQQAGLFPGSGKPPIVRPIALATRGRVEFTGKCPCGSWHRHVHLGLVTGPCGSVYDLQPRRARGAA